MKNDERFIELWNDYLEGEIDESGIAELQALAAGNEHLSQMAADGYQMHRLLGLIAQDSASRQDEFVRETLSRLPADDDHFVDGVMQHLPQRSSRRGAMARAPLAKWPFAVAAAAVIALSASLYFLRPASERPIAKVAGLNGSLQWTGDGGRVFYDLSVGTQLPGGTIEGMTPGSWFELEFNDGSAVTISGNSALTFSDYGQKKLYLKAGNVSGNVKPQPADRPMLIYTRSAMMEVLGTQFEVEADLVATMLNVSEGKVRIKRLSDGNTVDVPAKHRVIAAAGQDMRPAPVPDAANRWKSQLHLGPEGAYGKWSPRTATEEARLEAIGYTMPRGFTIYAAALGVSRGDTPPVILQAGSRLRVRGHIASSHEVYFGVSVMYAAGGFAGKFQTVRPAVEFSGGEDFEVLLDLRDFGLDPSLGEIKDKLPRTPFHLVLESVWCHTLDQPSGLEIIEVELLPPATSANPAPQPAPPVMDIWAATSQGDLDTVKRHLAAGTDIDAAFIAPGVVASGATPLHMAVLADQREVARFLIDEGANIDAPAKDEYGGTPLHWAAVLGRVEIARQLIAAGADVNARDNHGTPLDATRHEGLSESEARLEIAELLRAKGGKHRNE